jgi:UDP-N-acetylmuramoyl-tripeptide--D-alanyl-D-alanine ligase
VRSPLDREVWRDAVWWLRSQQPGLGAIYASAMVRRAVLAKHQQVVMVVGSYGKTTTTRAARVALGLSIDRWSESNPNTLGEVAWSMLREKAWRRHTVVEAGIAAPGQMARYARILRPHTTIVGWIGHEHLRAFGDLPTLRNEKADAVRCLPANGTAILNADDPNVRWMASQTSARIVWYGTTPDCDVWADNIELDWPHGMRFQLRTPRDCREMRTRLFGRRSVHSILAATAVALQAGLPLPEVTTRLSNLRPTRCRLQLMPLPNNAVVIRDEYKATPDTVFEALRLLSEIPTARRLVVIGELDNLPSVPVEPHYEQVGAAIGAVADLVLVVGPALSKYLPGLRSSGLPDACIMEADNVHQAIAVLRREVQGGDAILLKGQENDRLSRIALALAGSQVRCTRSTCTMYLQVCDECPLLNRAA